MSQAIAAAPPVFLVWNADDGSGRTVDPDTRQGFTRDGAELYAATLDDAVVLVSRNGSPFRPVGGVTVLARAARWARRLRRTR